MRKVTKVHYDPPVRTLNGWDMKIAGTETKIEYEDCDMVNNNLMSRENQIEEMARKTHFRLYKVWENMKSRCYNPKHKSYHRYGGRGITVCNQWKADFGAFEKWALESGYDGSAKQGQCTLDRIDNDKGYSPENCQWITNQENCNKTNFNLMYTHDGKTQSLADWSRDLGIKYNCLLSRMHRNGFDFEQAIIPRKNGSRHLIYDGAKMKGGAE